MDLERILVFFESPNGRDLWKAVERENIPDWLRDQSIVDRMIAGEQVVNTADKVPTFWRVVEIDRPRPAGQLAARKAAVAAAMGMSAGGIALH